MGTSWMFSAPAVVGDNQEIDSGLSVSLTGLAWSQLHNYAMEYLCACVYTHYQ